MYSSAFTFIAACAVYAAYSVFSIRRKTHTWAWHVLQWMSCLLFVGAGFLFGHWWQHGFNFHDFGNIMAVAVLGVTAYILSLRFFQARITED